MAWQGMVPAKEDQPSLRVGAHESVQHRGDDEGQSDRDQVLRILESGPQTVELDGVVLDTSASVRLLLWSPRLLARIESLREPFALAAGDWHTETHDMGLRF